MDLRYLAMGIFLTAWATLGGLLSGVVMGLFFLVYQDGYRKGVLPPQGERPVTSFLDSLREHGAAMKTPARPTFSMLASRLSGDHR